MLSICIPTYRYDVRPLIHELLRQSAELKEVVEILVYDDASPDDGDWGREELRQLKGIRYVELEKNLGRAAIRNRMAREATQPYLLLLDADGWPSPDFLLTYFNLLRQLKEKESFSIVWVGGRIYEETSPGPDRRLHWHYGRSRESSPAEQRREQPYLGFQSNNFVADKEVLLQFPFPEDVAGYGHEDTLWGQELKDRDVLLLHVDNPVIHLGLETNDVFLRKQREAIRNLALLHQQFPHLRTRLIDMVKKYPFALIVARMIPERWGKKLLISSPTLFLYVLDLLKLRWWGEEH
ncbi:glycosyltransferase family 2 protein [Neolewinella persica]|uniref:glycosyltransferase family 2 protein n=1 Tax=Neolewinella persica TaxID=70998 RepID=UPI00038203A5|nr:glycosyltransferase family 2 protein [Neolewinella persica]